jgi:hypothetical protein
MRNFPTSHAPSDTEGAAEAQEASAESSVRADGLGRAETGDDADHVR